MFPCVLSCKNKIEVGSVPLLAFLVYLFFIWLCEAFDLVVFMAGGKNHFILASAAIAALLTFFICFRFRSCILFAQKAEIDWLYFCGAAFIAVFGFYKCILPDTAFDTWHYHLAAQEPGFVNYFDDQLGLGNFQIWGFRLGDRLFYIFRAVLGYRIGTVLNSLVLILAYYQLIQLMQLFVRQLPRQLPKAFIEASALFVCMSQWILFDLGIYYVDIIAFPLAIEVIRLLMKAGTDRPSAGEILYFAVLNGFWLALKLTNVVFVIPAAILYAVILRSIRWKTLFLCGLLCAVPCMVYLVFNYSCTGNPLYPYYNTVFRSDLYPLADFKDRRWGPADTAGKLTWLFHAAFHPEERLAEIYDEFNARYVIALMLMVGLTDFYLVSRLKAKIGKAQEKYYHMELVLFVLASSVLWGFSTGYGRYYVFGIMMLEFTAFWAVAVIYAKLPSGVLRLSSLSGILAGVLVFFELALLSSVLNGTEWSWRNSFPSEKNVSLQKNMQYVLHDQKYQGTFDAGKVRAYIISESYRTGFAHWFTPDAKVFSLPYLGFLSSEMQAKYRDMLSELLEENDEVYDIVGIGTDMDAYTKKIFEFGIVEYLWTELRFSYPATMRSRR